MPNNDYIKRSDALEIAAEWCPDDDGSVGKVGDLREMLDQLESIPAADVEPKQRWIPVTERLPEVGSVYLALIISLSGKRKIGLTHYSLTTRKWQVEDYKIWNHVTHWMPLPEPPKEGQK